VFFTDLRFLFSSSRPLTLFSLPFFLDPKQGQLLPIYKRILSQNAEFLLSQCPQSHKTVGTDTEKKEKTTQTEGFIEIQFNSQNITKEEYSCLEKNDGEKRMRAHTDLNGICPTPTSHTRCSNHAKCAAAVSWCKRKRIHKMRVVV